MKKLTSLFWKVFIISVIFLSTDTISGYFSHMDETQTEEGYAYQILNTNYDDPVSGNIWYQIIWALIYSTVILAILVNREKTNRVIHALFTDWFFTIFLVIIFLSFLWSEYPELTLRKVLNFSGTIILGIYLSVEYQMRDILKMIAFALTTIAILSIIYILLYPTHGIIKTFDKYQLKNKWIGITGHPNRFGLLMGLNSIVLFTLILSSKRHEPVLTILCIFSIFLTIMSQFVTVYIALINCFFFILIHNILKRTRKRSIFLTALIIYLLAVSIGLLLLNIEDVLGFFGKDTTLTGRVDLWTVSIKAIEKNPMLGYGFGSFWLGEVEGESRDLSYYYGREIPQSHNTLIELILGVGVVGALFFMSSFIINAYNSVRYLEKYKGIMSMWPLIYLIFFATIFLVGSIVNRNALFILYVMQNFRVRGEITSSLQPEGEDI